MLKTYINNKQSLFRYFKGKDWKGGEEKPFNKQEKQDIMHKENHSYLHTPKGLKTDKNFVYRKEDEALKISGYK